MNYFDPSVYLIVLDLVALGIVLVWGGALLGWTKGKGKP